MFLAIVFTSALLVFVYGSILSEGSGNLTLALGEAQGKMDEIRNHSYDSITTDYNGVSFNLTYPAQGTGEIEITEVGADVADELLQVNITVSWPNKDDRTSTTSLLSLIAKK